MKGTVEFESVSKRYRLGTLGTLRGTVSAMLSRNGDSDDRQHMLWALRDVSFRVEPGESLGLIGPNGSGKTTTLKLLSNITRPTVGRIDVRGRIASLIELGAGFHPELTGRENIYLNGAILGLKQGEIRRKLDDIVAFSGLERFMDTPVKRYSSGMYVRLGFAVAAHVEADVLLVDAVLAVCDSEFSRKCIGRMEELRNSGTTLIFISHNMYQVQRLCNQALLLVRGETRYSGDTGEAISAYERAVQESTESNADFEPITQDGGQDTMVISGVKALDQAGHPASRLRHDQVLEVLITYRTYQPVVNPIFKIRLVRSDSNISTLTASSYQPDLAWTLGREGTVSVRFDPVQLVSGKYLVDVRVTDSMDSMSLAGAQSGWFYVEDPSFGHQTDRGVFIPNARWSHKPGDSEHDKVRARVIG